MNTTRKGVTIQQCIKCPNIFMMVGGNTPIGLAFPRPITKKWDGHHYQEMHGVCPNHRSKERIDVSS